MVDHRQIRIESRVNILGEHLLIVEYFTTWCTQCPKTVAWLEELEQKYEHAIFLRVSFFSLHLTTTLNHHIELSHQLESFHRSWTELFQVGKA